MKQSAEQQPVLLLAAHGTASPAGTATNHALVDAVRAALPDVRVDLAFLDVARPSLAEALDRHGARPTVVVPLQLTAGYHVHTDIPAVTAGRRAVRVAAHLGPDPLLLTAVADRLARARGSNRSARTTVLAGVGSSRATGWDELRNAADRLAARLGRPVHAVVIDDHLRRRLETWPAPVEVASYLLAEGTFDAMLWRACDGVAIAADPVGVHPALVALIRARYLASSATAGEPEPAVQSNRSR